MQHWAIKENMEYFGFDDKATQLIMSLYQNNTADVITDHGISPNSSKLRSSTR